MKTRPDQHSGSLTEQKGCLCNDTCKRLDFLVFSYKDDNRRSRLTALSLIWFLWNVKEPTPLFEKSKGSQTPVVWPTSPGLGGLSVRFTVIGHQRNRHEGVYLPPHNNSAIIDFVYLPGTVTSSLNCQDSTLGAISFSCAVLACGRRSRSSHARKNLWYPGYIIWNLIQPVNRPLVEPGNQGEGKAKRPVDKHLGPPFHGTRNASDPDASSYWLEH